MSSEEILKRLECYVEEVSSDEGSAKLEFCFSNTRVREERGMTIAGKTSKRFHRTGLVFPSSGKVKYQIKFGDFFFNQGRDPMIVKSSMDAEEDFLIREGEGDEEIGYWEIVANNWLLFSYNILRNPQKYMEPVSRLTMTTSGKENILPIIK